MKRTKILHFLWIILILQLTNCSSEERAQASAEQIYYNAQFYTVDDTQPIATAIAIENGRIIAIGQDADVLALKTEKTQVKDLEGAFAMPGFIEGHGHFTGLGMSLIHLNFLKSKNWEEIVHAVARKAEATPSGEWIKGRGWHQEKWDSYPGLSTDGYPHHHGLSEQTPDHPVLLSHASGHSLFANAKAMEIAGVTAETPDPRGGHIVKDSHGKPIGVFEETAMDLIYDAYIAYRDSLSQDDLHQEWLKAVDLAQQECLAKGITSFQDAGSSFQQIKHYQQLAEDKALDLRLWVMARESYTSMNAQLDDRFPIIDAADHFFTCRAIKSELDGALGAFGAWLLAPYDDKPDFVGQNTTLVATVDSIAQLAMRKNMQLCVHAIGDKANRETLNLFEKHYQQSDNKDHRWRIEHSQHIDPVDIPRFAQIGVIASMQAIHCTSDSPFVEKRLGAERARTGAYPWRSLLDAGAVVTNGTDAPVEDVDPIASFYASVSRKRPGDSRAFYAEQAMTRAEAIKAYTLSNAYAAFEEKDKGSLSVGKLADFVVLSKDLLKCEESEILDTEVLLTVVDGQVKYKQK